MWRYGQGDGGGRWELVGKVHGRGVGRRGLGRTASQDVGGGARLDGGQRSGERVLGAIGRREGAAAAHQMAVARVGLGARRVHRLGHCRDRGRSGSGALGQGALLFRSTLFDRCEALLGPRRVGRREGEVGGRGRVGEA
jgi:hypothetical protein